MAISNIRFAAKPTSGPQLPHQRDKFYSITAGPLITGGRYQDRGRSRRLSLRGPPMGLPSRCLGESVGAEQKRYAGKPLLGTREIADFCGAS
jgi:hypothetical protein